MLSPDGAHLFVGCEFTSISRSLRARYCFAFLGQKDGRCGRPRTCELHDGARDVILIVRRQTAHSLQGFIE
jgi:hypothetical protein